MDQIGAILNLVKEHPILTSVVTVVVFVGIAHELRMVVELLLFFVRALRRELGEVAVNIRTASHATVVAVDVSDAESIRHLLNAIESQASEEGTKVTPNKGTEKTP